MSDVVLVATSFLTKFGGIAIVAGGLAGWYGAVVSSLSDRRLRKFLQEQRKEIDKTIEAG